MDALLLLILQAAGCAMRVKQNLQQLAYSTVRICTCLSVTSLSILAILALFIYISYIMCKKCTWNIVTLSRCTSFGSAMSDKYSLPLQGNQYPSGAALASEAAALKREAMTAAAVLGLDITSRIPDVIAPIPARKAPVAQQQVAQQPPAIQQQTPPVAQPPLQVQTAAQSDAQQPAGLQAGVQSQQPAQPSQTQPLAQSFASAQQLQTHPLSAPQLPTYSPAQLLSLVMPNLQAQSQALQSGVQQAAAVQPIHMPGHAQSSQPAAHQPLQASQSNPVGAQSQAQPQQQQQSGPTVQAQLPRQQLQPQPQQAFSFLSLLQQQPNSAAVQKGLLDQLSGQSSGQQLPGLLLPTVSGQMQQVPNVAGLMQLLQQQAQAQQQAVAQQPASKHTADASNATG